jgi:hypothetical protein
MNNIDIKKLSEYTEITSLSGTDLIQVSEKVSTGVYQSTKCQLQTLTDYLSNEAFSVVATAPLSGDGSVGDPLILFYNTDTFITDNDGSLLINYAEDGNGESLKPSRSDHGHSNLALSGLNDVTITSANNDQSLVWNSSTSKWENKNLQYIKSFAYSIMIAGSVGEPVSAVINVDSVNPTNIFYADTNPTSPVTSAMTSWDGIFPIQLDTDTYLSTITINGVIGNY